MISSFFVSTRPRTSIALALAAFVAILGLAGTALPDMRASGAVAAENGLRDYLARSPGERTDALLVAGKSSFRTATGDRGDPVQRALGKIFDTPPELAIAGLTQATPLERLDPGLLVPLGNMSEVLESGNGAAAAASPSTPGGDAGFGNAPFPVLTGPIAPGGGSPAGPGIGNGGGGGGGVSPFPSDPAAVPEPGTWVLLLLGMAMTGAVMRSERAGRQSLAQ